MDPRFRTGYIDEIDRDGVIQRITEEATEIAKNLSNTQPPLNNMRNKRTLRLLKIKLKLGGRVKLRKILKKPDASFQRLTPEDVVKWNTK